MSLRLQTHPPIVVMTLVILGFLLIGRQVDARCTRMKIFDSEDGTGNSTNVRVIENLCHNAWPSDNPWHVKARSLRMTANLGCMKVWSSNSCTGQGQCVCQRNSRTLTSWNKATVGNTGALSFRECEGDTPSIGGVVTLYDQKHFQGSSLSLEIPENQCETLRYDEDWKNKVSSLKVTQGCVEIFNKAGCSGESQKFWNIDTELEFPPNEFDGQDSHWSNKIRSFKSCIPDEAAYYSNSPVY